MIKKIFFQIHWFLGITAGLILSLMGITGAIYSYEQQILKAINTESYVVAVQQQDKMTPAELYQHFTNKDAELKINSITISPDPAASSVVNIVKEGARRGHNMMVNPYNAEVLPEIKGQEFFAFIQQLHRNLTVGPIGKQITGACTLMLILFVLSGLYLRWPKKHSLRQWFAIKPKLKGRNFIWDLHAVVGTWVVVFYLVFAATGLYWSYDWWRNGMFAVLGVERPQMQQGGSGQNGGQGPSQARNGETQARGEGQGPRENRGGENQVRGEGQGSRAGREESPQVTTQDIQYALDATWVGFNQHLKDNYSTVTLNIPKDNKGELKLSFVDPVAQHERARNSATYNYQSNNLTEVEYYKDKKLNEKIMSSMLPVHRGSFMGPIYQFVAMLASLAMPLFFVTGWMLYLKRRKQKALTQYARAHSSAAQLDPQAEKWNIFYASQTGTAEQLAYNTSSSLQQAGLATEVKALKDLTLADLAQTPRALFIVSTYGTGDAPDVATGFVKKQMSQSANLAQLRYAVLALGSKEYAETFCTFGHQLNTWLAQQQARAVTDLIEVDNANKQDVERWFTALGNMTGGTVKAIIAEKTFDAWQLQHRELLNPHSLGEPVYEVLLKPQDQQVWHAGDIAEIQPGNSAERISQFLQKHQLTDTVALRDALRFKNLTNVINPVVAQHNDWITSLENLPTREYSIASIPQENVLRLVLRQAQVNGELGLGSGWLSTHANLTDNLPLRIRSNPSFHLIDDDRPIILIGNGTGIAGLLSLLKQRELNGFSQNWLVFGERQRNVDFFYQAQLQHWHKTGLLQHLDAVFSRDQAERIYVQDKIIEQHQRIVEWVARGAVIYVCGSIDGMASGVDAALTEILGEDLMQQLRTEARYRRDVY